MSQKARMLHKKEHFAEIGNMVDTKDLRILQLIMNISVGYDCMY